MTTTAIRLAPVDRIRARAKCWRPACRTEFGGYRTIAMLAGGRFVVAFCHRRIHDESGALVDRWKYATSEGAG